MKTDVLADTFHQNVPHPPLVISLAKKKKMKEKLWNDG